MLDELSAASSESFIEETHPIKWVNIIFLPFQRWWQLIIIGTVFLKCFFGPMASIPEWDCQDDDEEESTLLTYFTTYYEHVGDIVYCIDTFLYIMHRQVKEEAMKQEYPPKPAFHLLLDILSVIPFFELMSTTHEPCAKHPKIWPHILNFTELFVVYRLLNFSEFVVTHSKPKAFFGFLCLLFLGVNGLTCLFILVTRHGFCRNCYKGIYDWRIHLAYQPEYSTLSDGYIYVWKQIYLNVMGFSLPGRMPLALNEFIFNICLFELGYMLIIFIVIPKWFAETVMDLEPLNNYNSRVLRVIAQTKSHHPVPTAYLEVENFYSLIWNKRRGMYTIPNLVCVFPRYMRNHIKLDLIWPVFAHSPILRNTSASFKRCISEDIELTVKHAGERFFTGPSCYTKLYYLNTGIVQLIASDDSTVPMLSVTSGTIFGDVSFLLPALNRKVMMRCFTHCDVFAISRQNILRALHKFPEDRKNVIKLANDKINHAHSLYNKKTQRGLDRAEDEGIAWVKFRWWEVFEAVNSWKLDKHKSQKQIELPPEESDYHCSKYIGQLVLCEDIKLQKKAVFLKETFPWILTAHSTFSQKWFLIIKTAAFFSLVLTPINITRDRVKVTALSAAFSLFLDLLYIGDVLVLLSTAKLGKENIKSVVDVALERCKSKYFVFDVLSTPWTDILFSLVVLNEYEVVIRYNRLFKLYMLFCNRYEETWSDNIYPKSLLVFRVLVCYFCLLYIPAYFFYWIMKLGPEDEYLVFYGRGVCFPNKTCQTKLSPFGIWAIPISFTIERTFNVFSLDYASSKIAYIIIILSTINILIGIYWKSSAIAIIFLKQLEIVRYQTLATDVRKTYTEYEVHPDLLKRLDRFLNCHWRYFKGKDILHNTLLHDEPYDIYWNLQGAAAEKMISESKPFKGCDPALIQELAEKANFILYPKQSIIVMFGVINENVMWLYRGVTKCEYIDNEGGTLTKYISNRGFVFSMNSVFFGQNTIRMYGAASDCEILYINTQEFLKTIQKYPHEWSLYEMIHKELSPMFHNQFVYDVKRHREYKKEKKATKDTPTHKDDDEGGQADTKFDFLPKFMLDFRRDPESIITRCWILFRAITVYINLLNRHVQGGVGSAYRRQLIIVEYLIDNVGVLDIIIKFFIPYYDQDNGIIISHISKCALHYLCRGFLVDFFVSIIAREAILRLMLKQVSQTTVEYISTFVRYFQLYLFIGYFKYITDVPSKYSLYVKILKWQLLLMLIGFCICEYLLALCVFVDVNEDEEIVEVKFLPDSCWMPKYLSFQIDKHPNTQQMAMLFLSGINMAQSMVNAVFLGLFTATPSNNWSVTFCVLVVFLIYKYQCVYCISMLLLKFQVSSNNQGKINELINFLKSERVDKDVIKRTTAYFGYLWERTHLSFIKQILMNRRIGFVLRQDLTVFFYKRIFDKANTLLKGGESIKRMLCCYTEQMYFMADEEIVRELELGPYVYFMYRGTAGVFKNDEKLAVLTTGSIFGQLEGTMGRPLRVTVRALERVDILRISVNVFQNIITDNVRQNINANPDSALDYMAIRNPEAEPPTKTIAYILRGNKAIKLPWMPEVITVESHKWYIRWLFYALVVNPVMSSAISLLIVRLPKSLLLRTLLFCHFLDLSHVLYLVTEFYTMEIIVVNNKCIYKFLRLKHFTKLWMYLDILSVIVPVGATIAQSWEWQIARLLRIHRVFFFNDKTIIIRKRYVFNIVKITLLCLLMHTLVCGWLYFGCGFGLDAGRVFRMPPDTGLDRADWVEPYRRSGDGCRRITALSNLTGRRFNAVPRDWTGDYIVAFHYIVVLQARINMDVIFPATYSQISYKCIAVYILWLLEIWLGSVAIDVVYSRYRDMYQFDLKAERFLTFMQRVGMSRYLLQIIKNYNKLLWTKQRGQWLPEIIQEIPESLREDIMCSLYIHHLLTPAVFQQLPMYFLRQLALKLTRVVIFPGKVIINEGDVTGYIYFIHEGEVERRFTDKNGENRLSTVLTTNGYFGLIPGLFPKTPYQFAYSSRTVVDLITLYYEDWKDLISSYPDLKLRLYTAAKKFRI